jgi:V-type H+-transporting ATPase subunit a
MMNDSMKGEEYKEHVGLPQDEGGAGGGLQLGFVAGVILRERLPAFEKMLWRACRGNVFLRVAEIEDALEDPLAGDEVLKSVFVIFFQGTVIYPVLEFSNYTKNYNFRLCKREERI